MNAISARLHQGHEATAYLDVRPWGGGAHGRHGVAPGRRWAVASTFQAVCGQWRLQSTANVAVWHLSLQTSNVSRTSAEGPG